MRKEIFCTLGCMIKFEEKEKWHIYFCFF
jgi:hypothetical protein